MTCRHVLDLIDAGPFVDSPRAHLDAAWAHARQCVTCGPALETSEALTADLTALPQLAPPPDLAATVLAQIERLGDMDPAPAVTATPTSVIPSSLTDWSAWATVVGGLAAGAAIVVSVSSGDGPTLTFLSPARWRPADLVTLASPAPGTLVLGVGLALYVMGLLLPLGDRRRR